MRVCKIHKCEMRKVKDASLKSGFRFKCFFCRKEYSDRYKVKANESRRNSYRKNSVKIKKYYVDRMVKNVVRWRAESIRHSMQKTDKEFDSDYFSVDCIEKKISVGSCPICKVKFKYEPGSIYVKNEAAPTADRFDSSIGYTVKNTNFICWRCNRIKRSSTIDDLELIVNFLRNFNSLDRLKQS